MLSENNPDVIMLTVLNAEVRCSYSYSTCNNLATLDCLPEYSICKTIKEVQWKI